MSKITVPTISLEIQMNWERQNVLTRIKNGHYEYWHKGKWIDQECFDILSPEVEYQKPNPKGINACKKHGFLKGDKSY